MKPPNEGTYELPEDGFDGITLKVILQGPKGPKTFQVLIPFAHFLKNDNCFIFCIQLLGDYMINSVVT